MKKFRLTITEVQKGFVDVEAENRDAALEIYLDEYNDGNVTWTESSITDFDAEELELKCGGCKETVQTSDVYYEIPGGDIVCQECIVRMDTHELLCFMGCKWKIAEEEAAE